MVMSIPLQKADGTFDIAVPTGKVVLNISFVGYQSQSVTAAAGTANVLVTLNPSTTTQLSDIVVVGYSNKKREELTSAVDVVDAKKLKDVTANNIGSMLQGKVAGLQVVNSSGVPGAAAEIRLRGVFFCKCITVSLVCGGWSYRRQL